MNQAIPGYYYDAEKKRYFKIEASRTAPAQASWSADNVKRRQVATYEAELARKRAKLLQGRVKFSRAIKEPLMGGFLARELDVDKSDADVQAAAWLEGLREKGAVNLWNRRENGPSGNLPLMYIGNHDEKTGLGLIYASLDESTVIGAYVPRDKNDCIDMLPRSMNYVRSNQLRTEAIRCLQMSSLAYHEPSHRLLVTSREPGNQIGLLYTSPYRSEDVETDKPQWLIGAADLYHAQSLPSPDRNSAVVHTCTPAPSYSSDLSAVLGTTHGIIKFQGNERLSWLIPPRNITKQPSHHGRHQDCRELFSLAFQEGSPHVLFAGGRSNHVSIMDLRVAPDPLSSSPAPYLRHTSSVAHARSIGPHGVLAAGPRNGMALYDVRRLSPSSDRSAPWPSSLPVVTFPRFRNAAHVHFGLDVEPGVGVVAAAHDDGTVGMYSLRSGRRLRCAPVDAIASEDVVRSLAFKTLPRDRNASLFVGLGTCVRKYSFGVAHEAGEDLEE